MAKSHMNRYSESKKEKKSSIIWNFFSSVKLTIVLLIILATASIIGTLIPQREGAIEFAKNLSPEFFRLLSSLNLFDMYHALWFRLLIACLVLNLIICSANRFPTTLKRFHTLPRPDRLKPFKHLPTQQSILVQGQIKDIANKVNQFLQGRYKRISKKEDEKKHFFYGEKGRYSNFGVYLVHLSILIILIGALAGSFFGFEARVNILEGEQIDTVTLRGKMKPLKLGFDVRCDKFKVDFYKNGAPKEYQSQLSFYIGGKDPEKRTLLVNHPVKFKGITFYQASYGIVPGKNVLIKIDRQASKQKITELSVEVGNLIQLPGNDGQFKVADVKTDFMRMGPAVLILVKPNRGEEVRFWVFQRHETIEKQIPGLFDKFPKLNPSAFKPYTFFLDKVESRYYTGLQVNKDPGVFIVWTGFFLMIAGFFVTFFTSHRRIWVQISKDKTGIRVSVAGTAGKNPVGLQRELEHLTNDLGNLLTDKE